VPAKEVVAEKNQAEVVKIIYKLTFII
ncbi:uncharacterized protein METZ01_LOCUS440216, partial [marine metagenome]